MQYRSDSLIFFSVQVALKVIEKRAVSMNKKLFLRVRREISNLKRIRHSNVVQIYESKRLHTTRIITSLATSNYTAKLACVATGHFMIFLNSFLFRF